MYTQEDVRKLFTQRGEIEMELKVRQAQYYGRETETPPEMAERITALQRELMLIDGLFAALSENEAFVIRHHLMEELDWPQTMVLFVRKWGAQAEKSLRSMKALQEKGLRKIARLLNTRIGRKGGLSERRIAIIKEYNFYNQQYCGCEFSMRKEE